MKVSAMLRAIVATVALFGWAASEECRADVSLTELFGNNDTAQLMSGGLTFTFDKADVLTNNNGAAQTFDNVFVGVMGTQITFRFSMPFRVQGQAAMNPEVTITYTVVSSSPIGGAGLSFNASVPGKANMLSNPNASATVNESLSDNVMLNVFQRNDDDSVLSSNNSDAASLPDRPQTLTVTNTAALSIPVRGGMGEGEAQITSFTNSFTPEPSAFATAIVCGLGMIAYGLRRPQARA